ncbi:MAG TPA: sensor histidine kinase [Terriglobales bacterium]|jgi:two-component system sensor histidine kinase DesK|nr:sensor histidine kinase [Terriglobales bacterium]
MRLLPKEVKADAGWTPYIWLVWLSFFVADPAFHHQPSRGRWLLTLAATLLFLALYFWGFWLKGKQRLWAIAGIALLGIVFVPQNSGACGLFVYAAAFAGFAGGTEFAIGILVVLEACLSLVVWISHLPLSFWISMSFLVAAVGAMNIQHAKRIAANCRLRMAQGEVEHLAKTAERERIARDLHDVLGHTLSVIILKSELASRMVDKDLPRAIQEIRDVERISREALAEVRSALKGYRAAGLNAEMAQARATLETAGIKVQACSSQLDLNAAQEGVLALVMREAVTNVLRHSKATECSLRLAQANGCCTLEIADNGCGSSDVEGEGLKGMRQRVEMLGGSLQRKTSPSTTLIVTVPRIAIQTNGTQ